MAKSEKSKKKAALEGGAKTKSKAPVNKKSTAKKKLSPNKAPAKKKVPPAKTKAKPKSKPNKAPAKKLKKHPPFKPGNKLWQRRDRCGPRPKYEDPEVLWLAAVGYFEWCLKNPIKVPKIFCSAGEICKGELLNPRPMTYQGLCSHIGICTNTWDSYKESDLLGEVCREVAAIVYEQKFSGAASGVFNSGIIQRDLGLADRKEIEDITPSNLTPWDSITTDE